ncbi:MAG: type IV pilus twitching motility protein PilT [Desulfurivibrionaceae bacterium]|jgi:twitching motility protein PilT|nr:PilT/PilU family type 4a pilus ATPase [Pseudomonadota bacterium]MCG2824878.1 PilT/PilU family type 4a pilus ATPase [Desulfobulbaceae bacterium]MDP2003241.1 PilT/PilU family type 4a pilus ATPase [Desulfurivibrionaceae bacterium]
MKQTETDYWITSMLETYGNVSDLNITVGKPLQVETSGQLVPVTVEPPVPSLTPFQAEVFALNLIGGNKRLLDDLVKHGSCDLSYWLGQKARFRVNVFSQKTNLSTVLRKLEMKIPTITQLNLPKLFYNMAGERNGIILVTGATGSGKSTSLAALLDKINDEKPVHIVTLEDPIEYVHQHKMATFNQRELGNDFDSFASGLRAALRQAPKVILVGEMRDRETMEIGLSAAETGHLVLSTLHTVDAGQTINRILGMFEQEEQAQVRNRLVDTIRWIVCQRLLPKVGGGRVAAFEIMGMSLRVRELIMTGETEDKTYYDIIADAKALGWQTFDQHILELYEDGLITEETAASYCTRKTAVNRGLDSIKSARGESTTGITGLAMDVKQEEKRRSGF